MTITFGWNTLINSNAIVLSYHIEIMEGSDSDLKFDIELGSNITRFYFKVPTLCRNYKCKIAAKSSDGEGIYTTITVPAAAHGKIIRIIYLLKS